MIILFLISVVFIIVAVVLAWYLITHARGHKEPIAAVWIAAGFGVLALVLTVILSSLLLPGNIVELQPQVNLLNLRYNLTVGFIEEFAKFIPLAFFIYKKKYFSEHTDGIIYFAIAGLSFGVPENIIYTINYGGETGIFRLILTPLFHAATTSVAGFYLARSKFHSEKKLVSVVLPLLSVAILHGLYNFGLVSGNTALTLLSFFITFGLTASLFAFFIKARQLDQSLGLSIVGNNAFCRSCGAKNPSGYLHCTTCGKHA